MTSTAWKESKNDLEAGTKLHLECQLPLNRIAQFTQCCPSSYVSHGKKMGGN